MHTKCPTVTKSGQSNENALTLRSFAPREFAKSSTQIKPFEALRFEVTREPAEGDGGHIMGGTGTVPFAETYQEHAKK